MFLIGAVRSGLSLTCETPREKRGRQRVSLSSNTGVIKKVATDAETMEYLADNGYPEHIVRGGREGLVRRWSEFVDEVEQGYRYRLEDYRNDLDLRGVIAILQLDNDPLVSAADQRLQPMLEGTENRLWESSAGDFFWDFGYPRNASGQLLRDLAAAGLITPG